MNNNFSFGFDLFESFDDMCFMLSMNGEILKLNKSASNALNPGDESFIGKNFIDLMESSYKEKFRLIFTDCVVQSRSGNTFAVIQPNNKMIDISISIIPIKGEGEEKPYNYFILARDITEQRKKELDLLRFYYVAENTVKDRKS